MWLDLVGMEVFDQNGLNLGIVRQLFETGANDVLEVVSLSGSVTLIPFVMEQFIREVDLDEQRIEVHWFA